MRLVVKVGSNVLTRQDGTLNLERMQSLVAQVAQVMRMGHEVILVSSGAVACGRNILKTSEKLDEVEQRQLFSAVGQVSLMAHYRELFAAQGLHIGQVLTMKENFSTRRFYLNQRHCMSVMLRNGVVPVVNENDTVSVTELMFTDNDELSGILASMMGADSLIILSNIDGIYDGPPSSEGSRVIPYIEPGKDLSAYIQAKKSSFGRGGMLTKSSIASKVAQEGIRVIIANGTREQILPDLLTSPQTTVHTEFVPAAGVSSVKKWIAHSDGFAKGRVFINERATQALSQMKVMSLLMVGVTAVEGDFEEGDIINILDPAGHVVAVGKSGHSSREARELIGQHDVKPMVHYDYLYIL
ncbi:MAG: glutamate 5-kinase [Bacteroidales bacterium]|jgi:glutamate 5-kinase|nr:glutamate 5-kinase [Bacteroidales bacterium]MBQ1937626.1 glutamate 5-kinase [Bacteroidales bacterium]MBQ2452644.1 glutamate 5-kinase [Bacteroidales bacterium]